MTTKLSELLQTEMTRKQFLMTIGLGLLTVLGFEEIIKLLRKDSSLKPTIGAADLPPNYGHMKH